MGFVNFISLYLMTGVTAVVVPYETLRFRAVTGSETVIGRPDHLILLLELIKNASDKSHSASTVVNINAVGDFYVSKHFYPSNIYRF